MILTQIKIGWQSDKQKGAGLHSGLCQRLLAHDVAFLDDRSEQTCREHAADPSKAVSDWGTPTLDVLLTVDQYFEFAALPDVELTVKKRIKDKSENVTQPFTDAAQRGIPQGPTDANFNEKVEVHIAGQALSTYNSVLLLEDSCSDALQAALNKGWRIIAACPQPDARRPDYILGRFDPTMVVDGMAARNA